MARRVCAVGQLLNRHAAAFGSLEPDGHPESTQSLHLFICRSRTTWAYRLIYLECVCEIRRLLTGQLLDHFLSDQVEVRLDRDAVENCVGDLVRREDVFRVTFKV